jgi:hypothetical protein
MENGRHKLLNLICKSVLVASIAFAAICLCKLLYFCYQSEAQAKSHARQATHEAAVLIENKLKEIEATLEECAAASRTKTVPDSEMKAALEKRLKSNKILFGLIIAYAPHQYAPSEKLHSIYATWKNGEVDFTTLEKSYDYTDGKHDWYTLPITKGAVWSKPFWGKASNAMVVTYSIPVRRKNADGTGRHIATVSAVCSFASINDMVSSLNLGSSGYGFITDQNGTFIAHPSEKLVLDKITLTEYAKKNYSKASQETIEQGFKNFSSFLYQEPTKLTKQMGVITMEPIKSVGWFVASVLVKSEISFLQKDAKRHGISFIFALALSVIIFIAYLLWIHELEYRLSKLPRYAVVLTVTFVAGLIAIWGIEIALGLPSPYEEKGFMADKASLAKYLQNRKLSAIDLHKEPRQTIPTGIMLNSIKLTGLNEAEISGTIWQKIPTDNAVAKIQEGVRLPFATASTMEEAYRSVVGDMTVIGWNFTATLPQQFDNTLYPFDRQQIRIAMRQKKVLDRVQLVPDFASYDLYVPSANPYVMKDLLLPGWRIKQNYFTLLSKDYSTTFGYGNKALMEDSQDLTLTVTTQREILANFIYVFLPFFILAIIAYVALLITSGDEDKIAIFSFKPSNMQEVAASFLLFLVFSTIAIRSRIVSDKVLYVEYIFFFMYFIILGLIISSAKIAQKHEHSIFGFRDGLIVKLLFWPVVLGSMFFITIAVFF